MKEKEKKLVELIKWIMLETKIELNQEECRILFDYYKQAPEEKITDDFTYMRNNSYMIKDKIQQIKEYNINMLINWFISDTKGKIKVTKNDINILKNYYKNNKYIKEEKMVKDFTYMHESNEYFKDKINKISKEIIGVEDLKDENNTRYIKLKFGNGTEKVYESTLEEKGSTMFDVYMTSGENSRINTTKFFLDTVQTKNELTEEEIKNLHPIDEEIKTGGNGLSNQKSLGSHPGTGKVSLKWFEEGSMNKLLLVFLTGIATGIIMMILINNIK